MNSKLNHFFAAMLGICLVAASVPVSANKPQNITDAEWAQLPRYCADTMGFKYGDAYSNTSPNAGKWVGMMGKGFWYMHHYCWALINGRRAERAGVPSQTKQGLREEARGDYSFVVANVSQDFILLPEIYTWMGRNYVSLNDPKNAEKAFSKARELKSDYWPAYSHWAEYLLGKGRRAEALKIVTAGLQQSPDAKVLIELYRVLGGKASDLPKPVAKEQREAAPAASAEPVQPSPQPAESAPGSDHPPDASPVAK